MKRLKVSREGILLIKSFEGFRPRAVRHGEGWIIGYGHTLSAREGASVTEADAELLLHYDLLSVANSINDHISQSLNQHQFDALASFAFSIGIDRFNGSDVLARMTAGSTAEAADAMAGWPDPASLSAPMRRRAERALFVSDPHAAFTLSELLTAPLDPLPPLPPLPPALAETSGAPTSDTLVAPINTAAQPDAVFTPVTDAPAIKPTESFSTADSALSTTDPLSRYAAYSGDIVGPLVAPNAIGAADTPDLSGGLVVIPAVVAYEPSAQPADETPFTLTSDAADPPADEPDPEPFEVTDQPLLFGDDDAPETNQGLGPHRPGHVTTPLRFDWRKTGSYLVMGVFGLTTFGLSVVSLRKASLYQGSNQFLVIGAVLALLGLACVLVSAWNLYRRIDRSQT